MIALAESAIYAAVAVAVLLTATLTYAVVRPAGGRISDRAVGIAIASMFGVVLVLCVAALGLQGWQLGTLWQHP